ncbi:MAG: TonB-dependent receptor, partial [Acidobacteriota bacterium]|nr:TonB-dependent receptor [Acidobacteriota bacterium]
MRWRSVIFILLAAALPVLLRGASLPITLRGITHDPDHRPIAGALVTIHSMQSSFRAETRSNAEGEFEFQNILPGKYVINAIAPGFAEVTQPVAVTARDNPVIHLWLQIAAMKQAVRVSGAPAKLNTESSTTQTVVTKRQIGETPGAGLTNSLAMITDYVPGAYMVHDMLHVRGGHQENWFFDGIPVINTSIASNVGPLINPKNVESLQTQTGGYSTEYGDRTYGFFNVITPSGFSRNNEADLITSYGGFNQTDNLLSFGSHTERFAYYASVDGSRSDLGLSTPTPEILHDQTSGLGGFASVLFNPNASNQFRLVTSVRGDHYQIPNDPDQQAAGIRDIDNERDVLVGAAWARSTAGGTLLTVSPFYHFNRADYIGGAGDTPFVLNDNRRSDYAGALATLATTWGKHKASAGIEAWGQHDNTFFGLRANPGDKTLAQRFRPWANSEALFFEDQYKLTQWFTLNGGVRFSHYGGLISENAASPRLGAAIHIPRLGWVLRGYYAQYYQPPPLDTVSGPLLSFAVQQGYGFVPLHGERDVQHDIGVSIPVRDWVVDVDNFRTSAQNFLDHDEIG